MIWLNRSKFYIVYNYNNLEYLKNDWYRERSFCIDVDAFETCKFHDDEFGPFTGGGKPAQEGTTWEYPYILPLRGLHKCDSTIMVCTLKHTPNTQVEVSNDHQLMAHQMQSVPAKRSKYFQTFASNRNHIVEQFDAFWFVQKVIYHDCWISPFWLLHLRADECSG